MEVLFFSTIFISLQALAYTAPAPLKPESPVWFPIPYYGVSPPKYHGRVIFSNTYAGAFSCLGTEQPIYIIRKRAYCRDYYVCSKHNERSEVHNGRQYFRPQRIQCPEGTVFSTDTFRCEYNGRCEIPEYLLRPVRFLSEVPEGPRPEDYYVDHFYYMFRDPSDYYNYANTPAYREYLTPAPPGGRPIPGGIRLADIVEDILKILKIIPSHHNQRSKRSAEVEDNQLEFPLLEALSEDLTSLLPEVETTTESPSASEMITELMSSTESSTESSVDIQQWGEEFSKKIVGRFLGEKDAIFKLADKVMSIVAPLGAELLIQEFQFVTGFIPEIKIDRGMIEDIYEELKIEALPLGRPIFEKVPEILQDFSENVPLLVKYMEYMRKLAKESGQKIDSAVSEMLKKYDGVFKVSREDYILYSSLKDVVKDVESVIDVLSEALPSNVQRAMKRVEEYIDKFEDLL